MSISEAFSIALPQSILIILIVCAVLCSFGFYKFIYFISIGYGFAIAGAGAAMLVLFMHQMSVECLILCILFIIYGVRLGGYLWYREYKSASYRKTLDEQTKEAKQVPIFVKIVTWVLVSMLYVTQVSPVFYRLHNARIHGIMPVVGAVIMAVALGIEATADKQKSAAKKLNPNRFCDSGLYKIVRCPNYFGEILFWSGVLISGIDILTGGQWFVAILGYILIVYIMFSGAKRLEFHQNKNYGANEDYKKYVKKTPILLPFIPMYHLEKVWFIIK